MQSPESVRKCSLFTVVRDSVELGWRATCKHPASPARQSLAPRKGSLDDRESNRAGGDMA